MKSILTSLLVLLFCAPVNAEDTSIQLSLASPAEFQVFQRHARTAGNLKIAGSTQPRVEKVEWRLAGSPLDGELPETWTALPCDAEGRFSAETVAPAGGWYKFQIRALRDGKPTGEKTLEHVGIGDVFIIAGQSNSANHGSEKQKPASGKVASFDGKNWRISDDPQPGASGNGGSFLPAFGDALHAQTGVPVGLVALGIGATSVREWLPKGDRVQQQTTTGGGLKAAGPGEWEVVGQPFAKLTSRLKNFGPKGCRAILWHQGESDAGQARSGYPADRQITGAQYEKYMERLIKASREQAGWDVPWFTALVTYHSEKDAADEEFRTAQAAAWKSGLALQGPDSDALRKEFRDGVHFNGKGLQAHGKLWAEKVGPWLNNQLK